MFELFQGRNKVGLGRAVVLLQVMLIKFRIGFQQDFLKTNCQAIDGFALVIKTYVHNVKVAITTRKFSDNQSFYVTSFFQINDLTPMSIWNYLCQHHLYRHNYFGNDDSFLNFSLLYYQTSKTFSRITSSMLSVSTGE